MTGLLLAVRGQATVPARVPGQEAGVAAAGRGVVRRLGEPRRSGLRPRGRRVSRGPRQPFRHQQLGQRTHAAGTCRTCDETTVSAADGTPHGYVFEVPDNDYGSTTPIKEMGRFTHEAVAIDPGTGIVYLTEDATPRGCTDSSLADAEGWRPAARCRCWWSRTGRTLLLDLLRRHGHQILRLVGEHEMSARSTAARPHR